eukprot:TRINITY_DN39604_c0_g1_i1.p2 TRINITY_DN39604_c0_g1~~TRINITY_DN39604_c0_g1_i1.p2  ORF type:complete len:185 (+),score=48.81 TRINITY_DN39604_c0_g1_i1:310-864(+)
MHGNDVLRCLDEEQRARYQRLSVQKYVEAEEDTTCCPTAGCSFSFAWDPENRKLECPVCDSSFCLVCRVSPWHTGVRCEDYQAEHGTGGDEDKKFAAFAKKAKLRQCPRCRFFVEKKDGCDAMHCRCNAIFCYLCGGTRKKTEGVKQCKCPGVGSLLQAHEGMANHNLLGEDGGDDSEEEFEDY